MRFVSSEDGTPVAVVDPAVTPLIHELDTCGADDPVARAQELVEAELARPFDIAAGPLVRTLLIRIADNDHVLCLMMHHIVADGWSTDVLLNELVTAYTALRNGESPALADLPIVYSDFAVWQREHLLGAHADADVAYWRERLAGVPPLLLPTDRPYPQVQSVAGGAYRFQIDAGLGTALADVARAHQATMFMTVLAGFQALLGWACGQDDFAVGCPAAGRDRPETERLIGLFVNTVVHRADLTGDPTFAELLNRVRASAVAAVNHQALPFARLVTELNPVRDIGRSPLFQVSFAMQNWGRVRGPADTDSTPDGTALRLEPFDVHNPVTRHELALYIFEEDAGALTGFVTYNADLFTADTVSTLFTRFQRLLHQVATTPDLRLSEVDLLTDAERRDLAAWSDGGRPDSPTDWQVLTDAFDASVRSVPDATAVVHGARSLTYRDLDARANQLARHLTGLGAGRGTLVGICLEQSVDLAVCVLGVLKAGAAYLPLDPEQPPSRLQFLLADSGATILLTDRTLAQRTVGYTGRVVTVDTDAELIAALHDGPLEPAAGPEDRAYVIYTSGSTGTPKGVVVAHRPLVHYLHGVRERLRIVDGSRFGLLQSLSFDFSVTMFYLALATGGCVHLIPRRAAGPDLAAYLARTGIDYLKFTPSHLNALIADVDDPADLLPNRALVLGGEASHAEWASMLAGLGRAAVFNHYGPTEATVGITVYEVPPGATAAATSTPIGRPLPYGTVHLRDAGMRPVPVGVVGELYLGGERLADGYLNRPELTAERFVHDRSGERLYRTGDLARWLPDGNLEFLGRRDEQFKLRGYRIEPGEIENALAQLPGVAHAAVAVRDERIVAYLVRTGAPTGTPQRADLDISEVRRLLGETLPDYMLPSRLVWLDTLPLQAHGKIDRRALPEPAADRPDQSAGFAPPDGPVEEAIAAVWATVLGLPAVGAEDNFFDLGGHSLLATQVASRLRRALPAGATAVSVMDLFKYPTVRQLAARAAAPTDAGPALLHELTRPIDAALRALSLVCVPYGGASAVVFQPLADALPPGHSLFAVALPGHDIGHFVDGEPEPPQPLAEMAAACVTEILEKVDGPLAVYGHCGPGGALAMEISRQLEQADRRVECVYIGALFPFARPPGSLGRLARLARMERLRSDTVYANWLASVGADVGALDPDERRYLIRAMRRDAEAAEEYFTDLLHSEVTPIAAPIVCVVGDRDPVTEFYQERYREWGFLSDVTALVVFDEAGHYFLKYRADELAAVVSGTHTAIADGAVEPLTRAGRPDARWWLEGLSAGGRVAVDAGLPAPANATAVPAAAIGATATAQPGMGRFLVVALSQLISAVGTAVTEFAIPLWAYLDTGSLWRFALFAVVGTLPGVLVGPVAGALVDRGDKRRVLTVASVAAGVLQGGLAVLVWSDRLDMMALYAVLAAMSVALTFQRLAYFAAVPQLVPKHYLGHANGIVQLAGGLAWFLVPMLAVAMLSSVGLGGILMLDVISYVVAVAVLLVVRFPATMAWRRRESLADEIRHGFTYFWQRRGLRAMLLFFVALNGFLAAVLVLVSPLVLTIGTLADAGRVGTFAAVGGLAAGLVMAVWGGPRRMRMRGMLLSVVAFAASAAVVGSRPDLAVMTVGAVGLSFTLVVMNSIWITIIHTKVPQRFHGRVIALNQMVALTVLSLGFALAPFAGELLEPAMLPGGGLADTLGAIVGVGPGRGIAALYVICAAVIAALAVGSLLGTRLATFDRTVPDAEPDDVLGLTALSDRRVQPTTTGSRPLDQLDAR